MSEQPESDPILLGDLLRALFLPEQAPAPLTLSSEQAVTAPKVDLLPPAPAESLPEISYPAMIWLEQPADLRGLGLIVLGLALVFVGAGLLHVQVAAFSGWLLIIGGLLLSYSASRLWPASATLLDSLRPAPADPGPARLLAVDNATESMLRQAAALPGFALALASFFFSAGNRFTAATLILLLGGLTLLLFALGERPLRDMKADMETAFRVNLWPVPVIVLLITISGAFFLAMLLQDVPANMTSDHVELVLDVRRILSGEAYVYFPGAGGREPLLPYLLAALQGITGYPVDFMMMKSVGVAAALAALPLVFLLGRELSDLRGAFSAMVLYLMMLWPLSISRVGLQHALIPVLLLPLFIALLRGLRSGSRRSWLWAGVWAGLAAYGHESLRFALLLLPLAWIVAAAGPVAGLIRAGAQRLQHEAALIRQTANALLGAAVTLALLTPLLRVWVESPGAFWGLFLQRNGGFAPRLPTWPGAMWRALSLLLVRGDNSWFVSPEGPILDTWTGGLLLVGVGLLLFRVIRQRDCRDAFALLAIPLIMLPSGLALAAPAEIPSASRAFGAAPLVAVAAGLALSWLGALLRSTMAGTRGLAAVLAAALVLSYAVGQTTAERYFIEYRQIYDQSTWDHRGIALAAREAAGPDGILWVMGWPYWIDYRAVFIEDGHEGRYSPDMSSLALALGELGRLERTIVFVLHPDDAASYSLLASFYPQGDPQAESRPDGSQPYLMFIVSP